MKKILFALLFLFSFSPVYAASISNISTNSIEAMQSVTIYGSGFGDVGEYSYLCFNDDSSCIGGNNDLLLSWTDTAITFEMPLFVDTSGTLYVYSNSGDQTPAFVYNTQPTIGFVNYLGVPSTKADIGSTITIEGAFFGQGKGSVQFGIVNGEIVKWGENEIEVKVPMVNMDTKNLYVSRTDLKVSTPFEFHILVSATDRTTIFNDTLYSLQKYLKTIDFVDSTTNGPRKTDVVVAVLDDGVYLNHPDMQNRYWTNSGEFVGDNIDNDKNGYIDDSFGYNFISNNANLNVLGNHGTSVAGIIAANRNNEVGIVGISDRAKIMPVIVCDDSGCPLDSVKDGIKYAVDNGAKLINLSLGSNATNGFTTDYNDIIKYAYDHNVLMIISAGNGDIENGNGMDLTNIPQSPVCNDNEQNMVIGVSASTLLGDYRTDWTNYGSCTDVFAPGEDIVALKATGSVLYDVVDGTSFSAPIVTGILADVVSIYPNIRIATLQNYLFSNVNSNDGVLKMDSLLKALQSTYKDEGLFTPRSVVSTSISTKNYFTDVNHLYKNALAINFLKEKGVLQGYSDGTFKPDQEITRAELLKILIKGGLSIEPDNSYKTSCFKDVQATDWYAGYVCYAKEKGWAEGYPDGSFQPNKPINKVESLKFLVLIDAVPASNETSLPFIDVENDWYTKYVKAAYALNLLEETGNLLGVSNNVTRAAISENIFRLVILREKAAEVYHDALTTGL